MRNLELVSIAWLVVLLPLSIANKAPDHPKEYCLRTCGNVSIDYPFGIGEDCYLNEAFNVSCNVGGVLTLEKSDIDHKFTISAIRFPDQVLLLSHQIMARDCNNDTGMDRQSSVSFVLGEPFKVSSRANRFRALGCDTTAFIVNEDSNFGSRCGSRCDTQWIINSAGKKKHGGLGQCEIALPYNSSGYNYSVTDMFNYSASACWRTCSYAVLAEEGYNISNEVLDHFRNIQIPLVAEWAIQDGRCDRSSERSSTCGEHARCNYTASESGYHCYCNSDCEGNPYLNGTDGCRTGGTGFPALQVALAGGAVLAATLGASSYSYGSWAKKKAIMKLTSKLLQELKNTGDISSPDTPVDPNMSDADPSSFDGDGGPETGEGGFDTNIDDPNTADNNPRDFNQQDLKKAIKLYQKGRRIAIWASRRRIARADLPGQGPVEIRKYTVQERSELPLFVKGVRTLSRTVIHANVARLLGISTRERSLIYKQFSDRTLRDSLHTSPSDLDEGRLQEVVDHNIWAEERKEQLLGVAELAKECLQQGGKGRPKMQRVRNILSEWAPKGPRPQAQGGRPTYAADGRPGVAQNPDLEGQMANLQGQAQSALDVALTTSSSSFFFSLLHAAVSAPPIRDSDDDYDDVKRRDDRGLHRNSKLGSVLLPVSDGRLPVTASRTRSKN
ncbi:hypothetical protein MRB53_005412 [Persea americana]|uniref:Uncharacterized protein n=1 Tax=Persea americana TaxID=3435 RepID=A0ACC2ME92_PERAE|nr:hypothetical protein MRB53_005412 [Persea americana]